MYLVIYAHSSQSAVLLYMHPWAMVRFFIEKATEVRLISNRVSHFDYRGGTRRALYTCGLLVMVVAITTRVLQTDL